MLHFILALSTLIVTLYFGVMAWRESIRNNHAQEQEQEQGQGQDK